MKSPFPGMDPFMERRWNGIRLALTIYAADQLNLQFTGTGLRAELQQRLIDECHAERFRSSRPVISVLNISQSDVISDVGIGSSNASNATTLPRPLRLVDDEPTTQNFIEIRNYRGNGEVVTIIEFVSPTNKRPGDGRKQFLQKRKEAFRARVNFVEIDLTRGGRRRLPGPVASFVPALEATYLAVVRRFNPERHWEVYPMPLRDPLGPLALPLRKGDADAVLPLQPLVDRAHAAAAFEPFDYAGTLRPPLKPDDADWAKQLLAEAKVDGGS